MSSAGVGPLCFLKSTVNAAIYQENLEHFMLPAADKLYGEADFIFQQDFSTLPEVPKAGSMTMVLLCLTDQQTRLTWTPQRIYGVLSRGRWETPDPTTQMTWRSLSKTTWASITPEQCHRLIASMPCCIDAVIHAKGGPTKYWVHRNEYTCQKPDISVKNILFYWSYAIFKFSERLRGFSLSVSHNHQHFKK